jgi:hypothetical protein
MGRCSGRAWAHAASVLLSFDLFAGSPSTAFSQEGEEVIADPELAGSGGWSAGGADGDEAISDPELSGGAGQTGFEEDYGWGSVYTPKTHSKSQTPPEPEEDEYDPLANTGIGKIELLGQQAFDTHPDGDLEDFYETRLRFGGEVELRISRKLRLSVGTRIDFLWAAPHQNDPSLLARDQMGMVTRRYSPLEQDRYEVDIIPLAAYADWTAGEGVHLRLGVQPVSLGRMDGFSVTDMLAVLDFRPAPRADPASLRLAQPAVRLDWDLSSWATLQMVYVPWFMPHLQRANRDLYMQQALLGTGLGNGGNAFNLASGELLDPSYQTLATETALRYVGPAPDFSSPQIQGRLNFRGSSYEVALVGGTALEKLPSVYYIPLVDQILRGSTEEPMNPTDLPPGSEQLAGYIAQGSPIFDVAYHRYNMVGLDGSFDISPIQIGFELGYSPARYLLYAATTDGSSLPLPNVSQQICNPGQAGTPCEGAGTKGNVTNEKIRKGVPVMMGALHMEWLKGETFGIAGEVYLLQALQLPYDKSRDWLGAFPNTGLIMGGLVTGAYRVDEGRWSFELSALLTAGPSSMITPQIELRAAEGFYLNVGAQFYGGAQEIRMNPGFAPYDITFGGLLDRYDNVYLGFRWLP